MDYYLGSLRQTTGYDWITSNFMATQSTIDDSTVYYTGTPQEMTGHEIWLAIDAHVKRLRYFGSLPKYLAIYPWLGRGSSQNIRNLINPANTNEAFRIGYGPGTITHNELGITFDGTSYARTFINGVNMVPNSSYASIYIGSTATGNYTDFGLISSGIRFTLKTSFSGNLISEQYNNSTNIITTAHTSSTGYFQTHRTSDTSFKVKKDGVQIGSTDTDATGVSSLSSMSTTHGLIIGALNNSNAVQEIAPKNYRYFSFANNLTEAEADYEKESVELLLTDLNRLI